MRHRYMVSIYYAFIMSIAFTANADELSRMADKFYGDLATIIERNMNDPTTCVSEIEKYYSDHKETVERIRAMTEESMAHVMTMMDDTEMMTVEELEAFEEEMLNSDSERPIMSPEMTRYTEALEKFRIKYPEHGMRIAAKAMEFVPSVPDTVGTQILNDSAVRR